MLGGLFLPSFDGDVKNHLEKGEVGTEWHRLPTKRKNFQGMFARVMIG